MEDHRARRRDLIALERSQGHTADRTYSAKELSAIRIVDSLRQAEAASLWTTTDVEDVWRGMPFNQFSKAKMRDSKLYGLIASMNKGCALHLHLDASSTTGGLLDLAFAQPTLCLSSDVPFLPETISQSAIRFSYLPPSSPIFHPTPLAGLPSIFTPSYVPHTLIPVSVLRSNYPPELGGKEGFDSMITRRLVVDPGSVGWSPKKVWDQFQSIFNLSGGLLGFAPVWEACSSPSSSSRTSCTDTVCRYRASPPNLHRR